MADGDGQETETNTQNQPVPPTQQAPQESHSQPTNQSTTPPPFIKELRDTMNALPERIAMAISSAMPQQATSAPSDNNSAQSSGNTGNSSATNDDAPRSAGKKADQPKPPGKKTFAERWFSE